MMFIHEASLLELANATNATQRSGRIANGQTSSSFQAWMVLVAAQVGIVLAAEFLGQGIVDGLLQLGKPFGSLQHNFFSPYALIGLLASVPYISAARYLFYIDARTRADGWDIQVRFFALAAENEQRKFSS